MSVRTGFQPKMSGSRNGRGLDEQSLGISTTKRDDDGVQIHPPPRLGDARFLFVFHAGCSGSSH
jgi:hypothetical protein